MEKKIVFMFAGQGSQYYQMGRTLYENNRVFRSFVSTQDEIVYRLTGTSIIENLYQESHTISQPFNEIEYSHPTIFIMEYALAQTFNYYGMNPDIVVGASLGEIVAATLSDVIKLEDAIKLTLKQVEYFNNESCRGSMLSILAHYSLFHHFKEQGFQISLAAINFDENFVVSGTQAQIQKVKNELDKLSISSQYVPVDIAFHSPIMENGLEPFFKFEEEITKKAPRIPFYSSLHNKQIFELEKDYFGKVALGEIRIREAIQQIEEKYKPIYFDLSYTGTIANSTKRNLGQEASSRCISVVTPFMQKSMCEPSYIQNIIEKYSK